MDEQELLKELMAEGISVLLSPDKAAKKIAKKLAKKGRLNELKECVNALASKPYYQLHEQVDVPGYRQPLFYELLESQGIALDNQGFLRLRGEKVAFVGDSIVLLKGKEDKAKEALKKKLNKLPRKVKIASIPLVAVTLVTLLYVIGSHLIRSMGGLF